ncbi:hypothetical protein E2562_022782 [Oryza meyeriana var. granulata]|uniref:BHLH domain-containing protein n=1 Tax=Oryza meyeriana var. granulata TaxID=110450 RepID=A0A6G1FB25_9ORYZ|nr:hypothetical protein E2562_022782 [Oryza meyeriana var. granulata]
MNQDQRHGITFNGVPLSPLTPAAALEIDNAVVDAPNGKRKVRDGEEGRGSLQGNNVAVHGAGAESSGVRRGSGGGEQARVFAERERDRRRRMNDMFTDIRRLVPNLPEKSNKVEVVDGAIAYIKMLKAEEAKLEARKLELGRQLAAAAATTVGGASSSAAAAVTVAAYAPVGGASSSSAAAPVAMVAAPARSNTVVPPKQARGAVAPTPRPVSPQVASWPLPSPAAMPPPPPPAAAAAAAAPPASLKTWSWGANVVISVLGNIGNMTVRAPLRRPGVLPAVSAVLKKYSITVITSLSGTDPSKTQNLFMLYTSIDMPDMLPQFVNPKVFEAMYRAAAAEIAAWISTY